MSCFPFSGSAECAPAHGRARWCWCGSGSSGLRAAPDGPGPAWPGASASKTLVNRPTDGVSGNRQVNHSGCTSGLERPQDYHGHQLRHVTHLLVSPLRGWFTYCIRYGSLSRICCRSVLTFTVRILSFEFSLPTLIVRLFTTRPLRSFCPDRRGLVVRPALHRMRPRGAAQTRAPVVPGPAERAAPHSGHELVAPSSGR